MIENTTSDAAPAVETIVNVQEHARDESSRAAAPVGSGAAEQGGTATATTPRVAPPRLDRLPPWKVVLHNDDDSDMLFVVDTIVVLGVAQRDTAIMQMLEAHETGSAHLITTHRERAELLEEQFQSKGLTVTIEPE